MFGVLLISINNKQRFWYWAYTSPHTRARTRTHTRTRTHAHTHTCTRAHAHTHARACYTHTCAHTHTRAHTYLHTHTHIHIHAHTHITPTPPQQTFSNLWFCELGCSSRVTSTKLINLYIAMQNWDYFFVLCSKCHGKAILLWTIFKTNEKTDFLIFSYIL